MTQKQNLQDTLHDDDKITDIKKLHAVKYSFISSEITQPVTKFPLFMEIKGSFVHKSLSMHPILS
jgi:hypothetical protein